eukprot:COSAG03_NODE_1127_length_4765_cov_10.861552_3_plen_72_part_00
MRLGPAVLLSCVVLSAGLAYSVAEHTPVFIVAFVSACVSLSARARAQHHAPGLSALILLAGRSFLRCCSAS